MIATRVYGERFRELYERNPDRSVRTLRAIRDLLEWEASHKKK